jgi:cytochrome oxidase assembly protein ShyY1
VRFLLKPGWLAFIAVVIAFAVCCYTLLAPWQFRRNREQQALNQAIAASYAHAPQPLHTLVSPGSVPSPGIEWRQASARGEYLPRDQVLVRLRTVDGDPAYEVLTAFRTEDGRTIAVDRGYVRPNSVNRLEPVPPAPSGTVTVTGRIREDESDGKRRPPIQQDGTTQIYAVSSQTLGAITHQRVDPGYLLLVADQPGGLGVLPLPPTTDGPFLSYAWQWLTFGLMALFGLGYFIRLELLQRRGGGPDGDDGAEPEPGPEPDLPEPALPERDLAERDLAERDLAERDLMVRRYGKARF